MLNNHKKGNNEMQKKKMIHIRFIQKKDKLGGEEWAEENENTNHTGPA